MRSITRPGYTAVSRADRALVGVLAGVPHGKHDDVFRRLSNAANHGKLWLGVAGALALIPGRPRHAALHGLLAQAVASGLTNIVFKTLLPRARPLPAHLPDFRFVAPQPTSSSMPSGHSASAAAFAVGVGLVHPGAGIAVAPLAGAVAYSRVHTGAHWPSDVFIGCALGTGAALLIRHWWPVRPPIPTAQHHRVPVAPLPDGEGLAILVNTMGGSYDTETATTLAKVFPKANIKTAGSGPGIQQALADIVEDAATRALGVWGGDGTVGTVAAAATEHSLPLLTLPGGTLNHFARDAGMSSLTEAVAAATAGSGALADVGVVHVERGTTGRPEQINRLMLNTGSIGLYPDMVRRRELLQPALGKPIAAFVAMIRTFAGATPTALDVDGRRHKLWIMYVGRGRFYPRDHAPLVRPLLDDGVFDIRMITADEAFARLRLLGSVLTRTVATSRVTHVSESTGVRVAAGGDPLVLAVDGEALAGVRAVEFRLEPLKLTYYCPPRT